MSPRRVLDQFPHSLEAQLLRAGRAVEPPSPMRGRLLAKLGGAALMVESTTALGGKAAAGAVAHSATALKSSFVVLGAKWAGVGVIAGLGLMATARVAGVLPGTAAVPAARSVQVSRAAPSIPSHEPQGPAFRTTELADEQGEGQPEPRGPNLANGQRGAAPPRDSALGLEVLLIDGARRALGRNRTDTALGLLERHAREVRAPRLAEEADFLRAQALERSGRHAEAERAFEKFRRQYPASALGDPH